LTPRTLRDVAGVLAAAGIEEAMFEARMLVAHVSGVPFGLVRLWDFPVDGVRLAPLLARRVAREPMALILGRVGFWTLELEVSGETLIPRPDSEAVVEAALEHPAARVLDLGTGTGCLLLSVLAERPGAWGVGVDVVPAAVALARRNAAGNGLGERAAFVCGDWAEAIGGRFDLVLSNPPYIETGAIPGLMPEVREHEPMRALDGGADGLDAYRRLLAALPGVLAPEGVAVFELGFGQAEAVVALAAAAGFVHADMRRDLGGVARALVLRADRAQNSFGSAAVGG
jgi:release factor glutamine methyltransferase